MLMKNCSHMRLRKGKIMNACNMRIIMNALCIYVISCEDMWRPISPSVNDAPWKAEDKLGCLYCVIKNALVVRS